VIDYIVNGYGEFFFEFLLNANCLNGRNYYHNDFTYVQNVFTKGSSVVDYCVIPYENLRHYKNFEVKRASVIGNNSAISGIFDLKHIPDHSIMCWEFETNFSVEKSNSVHNNVKQNQHNFYAFSLFRFIKIKSRKGEMAAPGISNHHKQIICSCHAIAVNMSIWH
jgi:hypothetical protein